MRGIKRTISHWTAGTNVPSPVDLEAYNRLTRGDGVTVDGNQTIQDNVVTSDGDYAHHTLNLNAGSAGMAMCGMHGAKESPFDAGEYPITESQFMAHCKMLAEFHTEYDIPITPETCLTHAEVEPTLGIKQKNKWDITRLPWRDDIRGARPVGDYMRAIVRKFQDKPPRLNLVNHNKTPPAEIGNVDLPVRSIQAHLTSLGYFVGKQDGKFGPRTRAAVLAFQADHGLKVDGVVGPKTLAALQSAKPRPARNVTEQDLRKGGSRIIENADKVEGGVNFQTTLAVAAAGVAGGEQALETFQRAQGLLSQLVSFAWVIIPVAVVVIVGLLIRRYVRNIKEARVDNAVTGANDSL